MVSLAGDFRDGRYTQEEFQRLVEVNARPTYLMKPFQAYY